jgi:hypothetical protein
MRRPLRHALAALRAAGIEVERIHQAGKHTEIHLECGELVRLVRGNHPSRRFERGLRSHVRKIFKQNSKVSRHQRGSPPGHPGKDVKQ